MRLESIQSTADEFTNAPDDGAVKKAQNLRLLMPVHIDVACRSIRAIARPAE